MIGRRRPDMKHSDLPDDIQPGDYWKLLGDDGQPLVSRHPGKLTEYSWHVVAPGASPDDWMLGWLDRHTVREHEDGTISVRPGDGSSNSILIENRTHSWHGYIERGVWREC